MANSRRNRGVAPHSADRDAPDRYSAPKLVNLAIMVDLILRPGLFENLYHLARTVIAIGTFLGLAGKVRADNIDRQPAFNM